jgi:phenylalanyl-tRNA synthetase alpha chain
LWKQKVSARLKEITSLQKFKNAWKASVLDITLPGKRFSAFGHQHPLTKTIEEIEDICIGMGYEIAEGPEIETDHNNFELLNLPKGHPAREMHDSFLSLMWSEFAEDPYFTRSSAE